MTAEMRGEPAQLGDLARALAARLPEPAEPRPPAPPAAPVHALAHPLVRTVLAAFPGARVVDVRRRGGRARAAGLHYVPRITRAMARAEPETLWVFGDNCARAGFGGQAAELRGEPNAIGITTKHAPRRDEAAYFTDDDFPAFIAEAAPAFARLREHVEAGGAIVWPVDGIGTGRAELRTRAPRIWAALERARLKLEGIARGGC